MRVRNLVSWAGHLFSHVPGDILELPEAMAVDRIAAGLAEEAKADVEATKEHVLHVVSEAEAAVARVAEAVQSVPRRLRSMR